MSAIPWPSAKTAWILCAEGKVPCRDHPFGQRLVFSSRFDMPYVLPLQVKCPLFVVLPHPWSMAGPQNMEASLSGVVQKEMVM